jgi:FkbM family methyltransferase
MPATHTGESGPLGLAITQLLKSDPKPFFVQVGGFDGVSFDPLRPHVVKQTLSGLIAEPIPQYYEKLKTLYANTSNVTAVNCAITEEDGERTIWRFNPIAVERGLLPPHFAGISSFLMEDLLKETGVLGRSSPNAETTNALRSLVQPVPVQCRTMERLLREHGVEKVDILQIDTEGYDYIILKLFDFDKYRPAIVHYEHQHLSQTDRDAAEALLRDRGYAVHRENYDTLALRDTAAASMTPSQYSPLRSLALSLHGEGRSKDSLLLLEHLAAINPGDCETLRPLTKLLGAEGRTLEALAVLLKLKSAVTDPASVLPDIQASLAPAIECFNRHLATGEVDRAERYAAALVALAPRNPALLNAALSCNLALNRKEEAAKYEAALRSLDSKNNNVAVMDQGGNETEQRLSKALSPSSDHPLLRLRNLHDVMSEILIKPLDAQCRLRIEKILSAARGLEISVAPGSDWAAWEKHYRVMVDAADIDSVYAETPAAADEPPVQFATSSGAALNRKALRKHAARTGAKCIFFAAADRHYVDLYGRWYIKSILKQCDVPCLVVVHVIGGAGQLRDIADSIGIRDDRLVLAADSFDAAAVTTACYDSPPKGRIEKPVAHLQSVRFLRLGALLSELQRPVFVSDIDLLLQRRVSDLLDRCAGDDVVLNENSASPDAGARFTANLVLVNPTGNAGVFLRYLRSYLERMLAKPEVSRWIDQFALLLARHHLTVKGTNPRIGYFDTEKDINNVMFPSFQENPFRFLSLYHGFDLSSLEDSQQAEENPSHGKSCRKKLAA